MTFEVSVYVYLSVCLSVSLSLYAYVCFCVHVSVCLSLYTTICFVFVVHSFIQAISIAPLLVRYYSAWILCQSFTPKRHRQLRVKDLPKVLLVGLKPMTLRTKGDDSIRFVSRMSDFCTFTAH